MNSTGVPYQLRRSSRAQSLRLFVYPGGKLVVTTPLFASQTAIERFLLQKQEWILRTIQRLSKCKAQTRPRGSRREYLKYREAARVIAQARVAHFSQLYGFSVGKMSIRNQKTRWGSCSRKGNLSFNYKIALLPPELADYLVVHELCHLQEFNHGKRFWTLVAKTLPQYVHLRRELKAW